VTESQGWIAVGDSFTAGTGDEPRHGGWIPRTAAAFTQAGKITGFHNHAQRGVRLGDVLRTRFPASAGALASSAPSSAPMTSSNGAPPCQPSQTRPTG
jgi:lysophospholipase L1-like esterase